MDKVISPKITALTFGILVICFAAAFYVVAWQEPSQAPPGGNVPTPLNVGPTGQSKAGGLILNTGGAATGLIIDKGQVCIGADCRSSWPEGADLKNIQVTPIDWNAIRICQHGTCCTPWKDCDGDGRTYMAGNDCDEGCANCYVGSNISTITPDGKDQNCNGVVDELFTWTVAVTCTTDGPPGGCPYFRESAACHARCGALYPNYTGVNTYTTVTNEYVGPAEGWGGSKCEGYWWYGQYGGTGGAQYFTGFKNCICQLRGYR